MKKIIKNLSIAFIVFLLGLAVCNVVMGQSDPEPKTVVYYGKDPIAFTCEWGKKGYDITHTSGCATIFVVMKKREK